METNNKIERRNEGIKPIEIRFPNTVSDSEQSIFRCNDIWDIIPITKNGEMASVGRFQITKGGKLFGEIKESVCDIYF